MASIPVSSEDSSDEFVPDEVSSSSDDDDSDYNPGWSTKRGRGRVRGRSGRGGSASTRGRGKPGRLSMTPLPKLEPQEIQGFLYFIYHVVSSPVGSLCHSLCCGVVRRLSYVVCC